jgi:hypothetical protein
VIWCCTVPPLRYRARSTVVGIEDVGGRLERLFRDGPQVFKEELQHQVRISAVSLGQRMRALAPKGDLAPHIKDDVETSKASIGKKTVSARVGFITPKRADSRSDTTQAEVALYNEFQPNVQPFMRPAAEAEASEFRQRIIKALQSAERNLSVGGLL